MYSTSPVHCTQYTPTCMLISYPTPPRTHRNTHKTSKSNANSSTQFEIWARVWHTAPSVVCHTGVYCHMPLYASCGIFVFCIGVHCVSLPSAVRMGCGSGVVWLCVSIPPNTLLYTLLIHPFETHPRDTHPHDTHPLHTPLHPARYVYERSYESGGMHWPDVFDRLCVCLWAFVFFTACMLLTREAYTMGSLLLLILTPTIYQFHKYVDLGGGCGGSGGFLMCRTRYTPIHPYTHTHPYTTRWCQMRYKPRMTNIPLDVADAMPHAFLDPAMYQPASLRPGSVGWYPESGKVCVCSGGFVCCCCSTWVWWCGYHGGM